MRKVIAVTISFLLVLVMSGCQETLDKTPAEEYVYSHTDFLAYSFDEYVAKADLIVIGTIGSQSEETLYTESEYVPFTFSHLRVEQVIKGELPRGVIHLVETGDGRTYVSSLYDKSGGYLQKSDKVLVILNAFDKEEQKAFLKENGVAWKYPNPYTFSFGCRIWLDQDGSLNEERNRYDLSFVENGDTTDAIIEKIQAADRKPDENSSRVTSSEAETTQRTTETTVSSITQISSSTSHREENNKEVFGDITIHVGEYFVESGRRLVDRTGPIPKEEFMKKYPITVPNGFTAVEFCFETPTKTGLMFNEVENGVVVCAGKDGKSVLSVAVCDTKYVGLACVWNPKEEPRKSRINQTDVIISKQKDGTYRGQFEKNGYYYTFILSNMEQENAIATVKVLVN